jgi:hypothetical protein
MLAFSSRKRMPADVEAGLFGLLLCALALAGSARAQEIVKADSLVGKSVVVKNMYRSAGGVTITKLQSDKEVEAAREALQAALKKYPASFIERVLDTVYVGSELKWTSNRSRSVEGWMGLYRYQDRTIYMKFDGNAAVFESVFHHELAHGIHFGFYGKFSEAAWLAANPPGFQYTGVPDPGAPSPEVFQLGFVRPYAMHSLPEDVACLAECLIGDTQSFSRGVGRYDRITRKARVLISLYQAVDPVMTVAYFKLQQAEAERAAEAESLAGERGRPLLVSAAAERGAFVGSFKEGDRVTLFYRDGSRPRSKSNLTFESESPSNITLCRRRKARTEPELTVLAKVPRLTRDGSFSHTFNEDCAAVLKMDGAGAGGEERVRFEFQVDRSGRP